MEIKLYNLINDENDMPKLNVTNSIEYEVNGPEFMKPYDTILALCKLTNMHHLHMENVYMATYNHFGELIGFFHVATGHMDKVSSSDRIKATYMLLSGGFSFEIFHNHPIDDRSPSENDKISTTFEQCLATYMEMEYKGDYVVTKSGWTCVNDEESHEFGKVELEYINS